MCEIDLLSDFNYLKKRDLDPNTVTDSAIPDTLIYL